jgi:hypothetical protein
VIEVLRAYLQVASGVGEITRQRAVEAARQALAATPAGVVLPVAAAGVDGLTAQASALADDLVVVGRQNRELLRQLVRAEVETVITRLGLGGQAELEAQLSASRRRVRELEQSLAAGSTGRVVTSRASTPSDAAARTTRTARPRRSPSDRVHRRSVRRRRRPPGRSGAAGRQASRLLRAGQR